MSRFFLVLAVMTAACGGNEADDLGVGAQCSGTGDCNPDIMATCLMQFKGGYCGLTGCTSNADCPESSACVAHTDQTNYCFRICVDKAECNANRDPVNESNCSSNVTFVDAGFSGKACVPPSN